MMQNRKDISDWIIHFVHNRHPDDDLYVLADYAKESAIIEGQEFEMKIPHYFDKDGNPHDLSETISDNEYPINEDATAFEVLCKIVHDGFIRSGWSLRNGGPTIYGPSSAVCFTEMPLYALIEYAKTRGSYSGYVENYGIAFMKKELFSVGARPVIYGLSSTHKEVNENHEWAKYGLRVLHPDCGLGLYEQYRYINTNLTREPPIDWMHEREWRWPLRDTEKSIAGLSFLLSDAWGPQFTDVLLIVNTLEEQDNMLNLIKGMYDAESTNSGRDYNTNLLSTVKVVSLDSLVSEKIDLHSVRIEDIPFKQAKIMSVIKVSKAMRVKVKQHVTIAEQKGVEAIEEYKKLHPEHITKAFDWGHAYACTNDISEVTQALLEEELAHTYSNGKYIIYLGNRNWPYDDSKLLYIGAKAASEYLTQIFGQSFYPEVPPD